MQYAHPKLTTEEATKSLKPMIDFIASLGDVVNGTNAVVEVPSFYKFESEQVVPPLEVRQTTFPSQFLIDSNRRMLCRLYQVYLVEQPDALSKRRTLKPQLNARS